MSIEKARRAVVLYDGQPFAERVEALAREVARAEISRASAGGGDEDQHWRNPMNWPFVAVLLAVASACYILGFALASLNLVGAP